MTRSTQAIHQSSLKLPFFKRSDTGGNLDKNPVDRFVVYFSVVCKKGALKQNILTITNDRTTAL